MKDQDFENNIREEVKKIYDELNLSNMGDAFILWALKNLWLMEDQQSWEVQVGQGHDKGIDALWIDDENEVINIMQGKFFENRSKILDKKEFFKLTNSINWLNQTSQLKNNALIGKSGEFCEAMKKTFSINFILLVFGKISPDTIEEIKLFNTKKSIEKYNVEYYDFEKIKEKYEANQSVEEFEIPEDIELTFSNNEFFEKNSKDAIIGTVQTSELARLEAQYHYRLFHKNVRYFLGKKNKINEQIIKTLQDNEEKDNFWYYNNGITIICNNYEILEINKIKISGFQVVNGCQTTYAVSNCRDILGNSDVLIRIFKSKGAEFDLKVCETTNTQTPVKGRDLRSLDSIQKNLKKEFMKLGYYYEIKRYGFKTEKPLNIALENNLNNEKVAKAYLAFIGKPSDARSRLYRLFDKNEYYHVIFHKDRTVLQLLLPYLILKKIEELIKKKERTNEFNFLKYSEYLILAGIGYFIYKHYLNTNEITEDGWNKISLKKGFDCKQIDAFTEDLFNIIKNGLENSIKDEKKRVGNSNYSHEVYLKRNNSFNNLIEEIEKQDNYMVSSKKGSLFDSINWPLTD